MQLVTKNKEHKCDSFSCGFAFKKYSETKNIAIHMISNDSGVGTGWYMITITIGETLGGITELFLIAIHRVSAKLEVIHYDNKNRGFTSLSITNMTLDWLLIDSES
jgi:hypothetical protein